MHFRLLHNRAIIVYSKEKEANMAKNAHDNQIIDTWESFEESDVYKRKESNSTNPENLNIELHNNLDMNYQKTIDTIKFFLKSTLGKFSKNNQWKVEVWLDKENLKHADEDQLISCGVALKRPHLGTLYAKKMGASLNKAVSKSINVLEDAVRSERDRWKRVSSKRRSRRALVWQ